MIPHAPCSLTRREWILAGAIACSSSAARSAPSTLPTTESLAHSLAIALKKEAPLVVLVSLEGCSFCKRVRDNYLGPMRELQGLQVVQVDMRNHRLIKDFKDASLTQDELVRAWAIKVAPTVLFFGRGGTEVAERLVGGYIPDFYGAYLDERLRLAHLAVRG